MLPSFGGLSFPTSTHLYLITLSDSLISHSGCASSDTERFMPKTIWKRQYSLCTNLPHHQPAYITVRSCAHIPMLCAATKLAYGKYSRHHHHHHYYCCYHSIQTSVLIDATVHELTLNCTSCGHVVGSSVAGHELWGRQPLPAA